MNDPAQTASFFSIAGALPSEMIVLLVITLLVSAAGFYRFVWFISLGYAFSVAAMAVASLFLFYTTLGPLTGLQCALLAAYGVRLGAFLARREWKASYRRELEDNERAGHGRRAGA